MPLSSFSVDKLIFDPAAPDDTNNVGSYLRAGTDGDLISSTNIGGKEALDVNLVGGADSGIFDEDSAHTSGDKGQFILAVRSDADASLVDTDGDYAPLQVDENGRLKVVADLEIAISMEKAEDSAHVSGDIGSFSLGVRQDTLASSVDTDGDYAALKVNSRGAMWVAPVGTVADDAVDTENPVKIGTRALAGPLSAVASGDRADAISDLYRRMYVNTSANIGISASAVSIDDTAGGTLVAAALAGRRTLLVSNRGNKPIYIGATGVTAAAGFTVNAGATISVDLGPNVDLYAIADTGNTVACRVLQLA